MVLKDGRLPLNIRELKQQRKRLGLSQDKLAEACFDQGFVVSISSIKRAESGANVLYRTAKNLAEFYGIPVERLLLDSSQPEDAGNTAADTQAHPVEASDLTAMSAPTPDDSDAEGHSSLQALAAKGVTHLSLKLQYHASVNIHVLLSLLANQRILNPANATFVCIHWQPDDEDEYIFERIRSQCDMLLRTFPNQLKLVLEAVAPTDHDESPVFPCLDWGDIAACSVFVSSDDFTPIARMESAQYKDMYRVSLLKTEQEDFVGRKDEMAQLEGAINHLVIQQQGQAICLSGMAGIGKTRLLKESLRHAHRLSCHISQLQLLNRGVVDNHAPINALVRALHEFDLDDEDHFIRNQMLLSAIPSQSHLVLFWLMGVELNTTEKRLLELMDFQTQQSAIAHAIEQVMAVRPSFPPRIICLEDVHWADDRLLTAVKAMLPELQASNILLLMTFRQQHQLSQHQDWFHHVDLIELTPLSDSEAEQLAHQLCQQQSHAINDSATDSTHIRNCLAMAQGHPLYLRQSLLCAQTQQVVPDSMEHLVAAQLSRLTSADLRAIQVASVLGQCFQLEQLRAITKNPGFVPDQLLTLGLIKRQGSQFMFHHDLICSAVIAQIPAAEFKTIHQRCALWFSDKDRYEYAVHYLHSAAPDATAVILETVQQLMESFQPQKALSLLEAILTKGNRHTTSREQKAQALNLKGLCLFAMGRVNDCIPALESAIKKSSGHTASTSHSPLPTYLLDLATTYRMTDRNEEAMRVLDESQQLAQQQHQFAVLADIHSMRGNMLFPTGDLGGCEREHQQSLAYAERLRDPAAMAQAKAKALGGLGDCAYAQAKMTTAYQALQACLDLCNEHQLLKVEASNRFMLGTVLIYQLKYTDALQELQLASNLARLTSNRRAEIVSRLTTGWILLDLGALAQAEQEIQTAMTLAEQLQASRFVAFLLESKARLLWQQGKQQEAQSAINQGMTLVKDNGMERFIGPWLCATQALIGNQRQAIEAALEQGEVWLQQPCVGHNYLRFYQQSLQTAWRLQQPDRIKRYRDRLEQFTRAEPNPWANLYMEQADLMLRLIHQTAFAHELLAFNQKLETMGIETAKVDIRMMQVESGTANQGH